MSYRGRGRGRQPSYFDGDSGKGGPFRRETYVAETPEQKVKNTVYKYGDQEDHNATRALPQLAESLLAQLPTSRKWITDALRTGAIEQPYKVTHYAAIIALMAQPDRAQKPETNGTDQQMDPPPGESVVEDLFREFQNSSLGRLAWKEIRPTVHLFAHLTVAGLIAPASMLELLQAFTAVLDEPGVSHSRGLQAALCAGEGLLRAGQILHESSAEGVANIIAALQSFASATSVAKSVVGPLVRQYGEADSSDGRSYDVLDSLVTCLQSLASSSFTNVALPLPNPQALYPLPPPSQESAYALPTILVPPEIIEFDGIGDNTGDVGRTSYARNFPEMYLRLFDDNVTISPSTPSGYLLRRLVSDVIDIFEVNRKEAARVLIELPRWLQPGTFKTKDAPEGTPEGEWQLEPLVVEMILSSICILPAPPEKPVYYFSLLTELCKLLPQTAGPAVGKSIRRFYLLLGEGLGVEPARRFAEWFAVHMSNFGFTWVWKEWTPDLTLPSYHPKRTYMRSAVGLEIRLSYYDRVMKTLPEPMQPPEAGVAPQQAPVAEFEYGAQGHPLFDTASQILDLMQKRKPVEDIITHLGRAKTQLSEVDGFPLTKADQLVRKIALQSLLSIGSRSFSHLLNAIERYIALLRHLSTSSDAKTDLLDATITFWRQDQQRVLMVFDKLMQYQIVDPVDIIKWCFRAVQDDEPKDETMNGHAARPALWLNTFKWEMLKAALDKANGRVAVAKRRVATVRKEDDDAPGKSSNVPEDELMDGKDAVPTLSPVKESQALTTALKALATLTRDQKSALAAALSGFVHTLLQSPQPSEGNSWETRAEWTQTEWECWETWGWFRFFCVSYSPYLRSYLNTLQAVVLSDLVVPEGCDPSAPIIIRKVWDVAQGAE